VAVVPNALLKETEVLGPTVDKVMFGIPVTPVAIAIGLLVVFMRFGFSLFHGLDLACSNKNLIVQANFDEAEREVLLQSFKDAYLIDTFLIYLNKPLLRQDIKIRQKRLAALIVNFILNASLLYAQFIVVMAFAQKSPMWAYGAAGLYFVLFAIFASKVIALPKMYQEISETRPRPIYIISGIYLLLPILSALISVLVLSGMI
jgi:hypothetical protein